MKKFICFLLMALLMIGLCACEELEKEGDKPTNTESETTSTKSEPASAESEPASTESEGTSADNDGVRYDENGNVILSDPPTYEQIRALHEQDPETYRDPGDLQPECKEMIRLEDGQWYQSYVASSFNCRFIFLSDKEAELSSSWGFRPIGSAENYFLFNVGVMYDDPSGEALYWERSVAVRGTLAEGVGGYAYLLQLPDELILCLEREGWSGMCYFAQSKTLAIPEKYASLFEGKTGEVIVTGTVKCDEDGMFYLKNVELYG